MCQAISNLGIEENFKILKAVANGEYDRNDQARTIAIYGMAARHFPRRMRLEVSVYILVYF